MDPKPQEQKEDLLKKSRQGIRLAKATTQVVKDLHSGSPHLAVSRALINGMKLASYSPFHNPSTHALTLAEEIKKMGIRVLAWEPEILMAEIDRKELGWTPERVQEAITNFHRTGILDTEVPALVRNKIYALRLVATSDSPHSEWSVFEKVGGAFNDRVPQFGLSEPLTAAECARTIHMIENIRPDSYSDEVKIYIAACCHEDGLYTLEPIPELAIAETSLKNFIKDESGDEQNFSLKQDIIRRYNELKTRPGTIREVADDIAEIQATRLLAIAAHSKEGT